MLLNAIPVIVQSIQQTQSPNLGSNLLVETFLNPGLVVKLVLFILFAMSVICWGIILYKYIVFRRAQRHSRQFSVLFSQGHSLAEIYRSSRQPRHNPLREVFDAGYKEFAKLLTRTAQVSKTPEESSPPDSKVGAVENIRRALRKAQTQAMTNLESALTFLATTGSTAPFIGLFGTVWGIMTAFRNIGVTGSANLAAVAPGIAEALIATAVGLFAAIPAVIAYNYFLNWARVLASEIENFSSDFQTITERHLRIT
jgi:biopolymer transport protein TolQ